MVKKEDITLNYTLAQLHPKAWFGWKKSFRWKNSRYYPAFRFFKIT